ncbi:MAG: hypothetical protein A3F46_08585 [Legionellales bacterium RIFCSPHIGHO2_12_FULL_42_9]|nr:MAG: hypothetical protein A3F46_08585 [Legionellales bacterium RIFCSPHIGHO2_12_FULL_42_9]
MKKHIIVHVVLATSFLLLSQLIWAEKPSVATNFWQCTTTDAESKVWTIDGNYQLTAINESFAACKKQSAYPKSCKTSKKNCEHFVNGQSTRPMWRCVALDRAASIWPSNVYAVRDDAALAGLAYCKDNSDIPASCYMNMITCRNLNAQNDAMGE